MGSKSFWDKFAKIYSPFMKSSEGLYLEITNEIRPYLNQNMKVLELACGPGQLTFKLAEYSESWEATDFSPNMIKEAEKKSVPGKIHFSVQDAAKLPYGNGSFDAVLIANALHIMPNPDEALAEIHRVLKPNGLLFAPTFIHGESAGFRFRVKLMELFGFKTYFKWNDIQFKEYVSGRGYRILQHRVIGSKITPLCALIAEKE